MNETLYEITRDLVLLNDLDVLEPTNGTEEQEGGPEEARLEQIREVLDNLNMKFVDKVTNIVKFVKNLQAQRDAVACEEKRLIERKKAIDNRIDWLKGYVKSSMQAAQSDKIKYALFTIYVGQSQPSVEVLNLDEVDEQFIKIKKEVDKSKILELVKCTGVIPSGVNIVQGTHLVIR